MCEWSEDSWFVLRTKSRHERIVEAVLQQKNIPRYLPKCQSIKLGEGRRRKVEMPLFPGYIFVRPSQNQLPDMRYIRGSCGLLMATDIKPAVIQGQEVESVRILADSRADLTVDEGFLPGQRVRIMDGRLAGAEGELVLIKRRHVLVLNVEFANRNVRVEVDRDAIAVL